jgi:NADPH-dependent 2,4-dienoyl-CoA reductase/sulfur reductase-like enzyme
VNLPRLKPHGITLGRALECGDLSPLLKAVTSRSTPRAEKHIANLDARMKRQQHTCDVLIVGGGPAGLAAGYSAAQSSQRVIIVDDNSSPGGQIWRGEQRQPTTPEAAAWFEKVQTANLDFLSGARVIFAIGCGGNSSKPVAPATAEPASENEARPGMLVAESFDSTYELAYEKLILATGARERFLPFPGWTLPNVMGAGGLQALVKSGLPIAGRRVVVAGSGPLLLAVAAYLSKHGAEVLSIAEQASWFHLLRFGFGLLRQPGKILQALEHSAELAGVLFLTNCWPVAAQGDGKLSSVTLRQGERSWDVACDYLACGFHLIPNVELAVLLGCQVQDGCVRVDEFQQASIPGIYCAGEPTGIGGLELSLIEGQIAGFAATGQHDQARKLFTAREKMRGFATLLNQTFALRAELRELPEAETLVCRCEDVTLERLRMYGSWREAKLQTRVGMGCCQGRVCGAAVEFLLGWKPESVRPPVFPARVESLMQVSGGLKG